MKFLSIIGLIIVLTLSTVAAVREDSGPCLLSLLQDRNRAWHDLIQGYLYALYPNPPATVHDCGICNEVAGRAGMIQKMVAELESIRDKWFNIEALYRLSFWDRISIMFRLFALFYSIGSNFIGIIDSGIPEKLYWQV